MAMDAANRLSAIDAEMGQLNNVKEKNLVGGCFLLRSVRTIDPARKEKKRSFRQRVEDGEAASASGRAASTQSAGCHPRSALEESTLLFKLSVCKCKVVCFHLRSDFALFGGDLLLCVLSFFSLLCLHVWSNP